MDEGDVDGRGAAAAVAEEEEEGEEEREKVSDAIPSTSLWI